MFTTIQNARIAERHVRHRRRLVPLLRLDDLEDAEDDGPETAARNDRADESQDAPELRAVVPGRLRLPVWLLPYAVPVRLLPVRGLLRWVAHAWPPGCPGQ